MILKAISRFLAPLVACILATAACGPSPNGVSEVNALPTVNIENNPTCNAGACRTLEVRAFVWSFNVPQPAWGYKVLGEMRGATGCFTFPPSWSFQVISLSDTIPGAPADTITLTWAPDSAPGIFVVAVDSALFHGGTTRPENTIRGRTWTFVPGSARGWDATLSGSADSTRAVAGQPCR